MTLRAMPYMEGIEFELHFEDSEDSDYGSERIEWVEIVEPRSREHMYANLTTGECVWEPPPGVPVKRHDGNQWWELFDANTGRFYYYHAGAQKTVWHRPQAADIIPLAKLQTLKNNTEGQNVSNNNLYDVPRSPTSSLDAVNQQSAPPSALHSAHARTATATCQTSPAPSPAARRRSSNKDRLQQFQAPPAPERSRSASRTSSNMTTAKAVNTVLDDLEQEFATYMQMHERVASETPSTSSHAHKFPVDERELLFTSPRTSASSSPMPPQSQPPRHPPPHTTQQNVTANIRSSQRRDQTPGARSPQRLRLSEARIVPTRPRHTNESADGAASSTNSTSDGRIKEATITTIAGSPRLWGATRRKRSDELTNEPNVSGSPIWTQRAEMAMIKSLDSGIKSTDSQALVGDVHAEKVSPRTDRHVVSIDIGTTATETETKDGGEKQHKQAPIATISPPAQLDTDSSDPPSVIARAPVTQAIIDARIASPERNLTPHDISVPNVSDDEDHIQVEVVQYSDNEAPLNDDEHLFVDDDAVDIESHYTVQSTDDERTLSTSKGVPSTHHNAGMYVPAPQVPSVRAPEPRHMSERVAYGSVGPRAGSGIVMGVGRLSDSRLIRSRQADAQSVGNPVDRYSHKDKNMFDDSGSSVGAPSLDRSTFSKYPGDISPPRPQSMMINNGNTHQLPPNTATLSRAVKGHHGNVVTRSASSLTRASHGSSGSQQLSIHSSTVLADSINRHKKGLFRKRVSVQSMLSFAREAISQPLIMTEDKSVKKEAVSIFKRIQAYMGDRKVKSGVSADQLALDVVLRGWTRQVLRDEIFMQLCKQTTDNPRADSSRRGWELLSICLSFFGPSSSMQSYLDSHIGKHSDPVLDNNGAHISHYAQYCQRKMERMQNAEARRQALGTSGEQVAPAMHRFGKLSTRKPSIEDIEAARIHIFHPSMFGNTLEEIMLAQADKFPRRQLPWIQTTLSELVLSLQGQKLEGIFRVPGDADEVNALKIRMDRWLVPVVSDAHVPASLLKLWYRELAEPLIPPTLYDTCLEACEDAEKACSIVDNKLPRINRFVLAYLIRFLQVFIRPDNVALSKMDASNLAMVFAPNCLRCESADPHVIFENTRKEMSFIRTLMLHYDTEFLQSVI